MFQLMAAIEGGVIAAMQPAIVRRGLKFRSLAVSSGFKSDRHSGAGGVMNIQSRSLAARSLPGGVEWWALPVLVRRHGLLEAEWTHIGPVGLYIGEAIGL